jgi:hypothetical protein
MPFYRLYHVSPDSRFKGAPEVIELDNDALALAAADQLLQPGWGIEVWQDTRFVEQRGQVSRSRRADLIGGDDPVPA